MDYLLYLEPYSFIFFADNEYIVYNTLNSAYLKSPDHPPVNDIMRKLNDPINGYGVVINDDDLDDLIVVDFITEIRNSFSGDCIVYNKESMKPYLFKPTLFFNTEIRALDEGSETIIGDKILQNLQEITFYLPTSCTNKCEGCGSYYKQFIHCSVFDNTRLTISDYDRICKEAYAGGIKKINIVGTYLACNDFSASLFDILKLYKFSINCYIDYSDFSDSYTNLLNTDSCRLIVYIHSGHFSENIFQEISRYDKYDVKWIFVVSNKDELKFAIKHQENTNSKIEIAPFYNGINKSFFEDYVYLNIDDITSDSIDRQSIFRHKVLNENFFGKLHIIPSGDVYANMNQASLGNILNGSLKELVYKELYNSSAWLKVRDNTPCLHCVNRLLCPSPSNYELVIGKSNLCHIKP